MRSNKSLTKENWDLLLKHVSEPWEEYGDDHLICEQKGDYYQIRDDEDDEILYYEIASRNCELRKCVGRVLSCIADGDSNEVTSIDIVMIDADEEDNIIIHMDKPE